MIMVPPLTGTPSSLPPWTRKGPCGPKKLPGEGPLENLAGPLLLFDDLDFALLSAVNLVPFLGVDFSFSSVIAPLLFVVKLFLVVGIIADLGILSGATLLAYKIPVKKPASSRSLQSSIFDTPFLVNVMRTFFFISRATLSESCMAVLPTIYAVSNIVSTSVVRIICQQMVSRHTYWTAHILYHSLSISPALLSLSWFR